MLRAILLLLLLAAGGALGQHRLVSHVYDPVKTRSEVRVTALFSEVPTSGYMPVRIYIKNATKIPRTWTFRFNSLDSGWRDEGNEMRSSFSAFCDAGEITSYEFLVPLVTAFQDYNSATELTLGVSAAGLMPLDASMITNYDTRWPAVAISADLHTVNGSKLEAEARKHLTPGGSGGHGHGPAHMHHGMAPQISFGGSFDPGQLSEDWRAYSGLDVLVMTEEDWKDIRPGARNAILRWNRIGGSLVIYTTSGATDLKTLGILDDGRGERVDERSWGRAQILEAGAGRVIDASQAVETVSTEIPTAVGKSTLSTLRSDFVGRWPLQAAFGSKKAHVVFFILVLIAFGVLVGPVNLFVFAKAGQRHRLFITTPLISLGASLLLVVLIIFQDGFGGRGQRVVLMEVRPDNGENAAYIAQEQFARTGVLLSSNFTTSEPAYLSPVLIDDSRWARVTPGNNGGKSRYTTDVIEQGLKVAGDWFQSRSEHGHFLQTVRPTRGRIEMASLDPPVVVSTFAFPLGTLYYTSVDGDHWVAENVQRGRRTTLKPTPEPAFIAWVNAQKSMFSVRNQKRLGLAAERSGHFLASSSEVPAIETLGSIRWLETSAVVTGPVVAP
ncbi:MAG: hypothetical protein HKN82_05080 [Akkermansiaceae bacterium]|nr:hypothetical protein [Akkermansiaceae bacterium]